MYIQLKPEHEQFIQAQIANGKYKNPEEIIDIAFQLLKKLNTEQEISTKVEVNRQQTNHQSFLEAANKAYEALRNNPEAWQEELDIGNYGNKRASDGLEEA